MSPILRNSTVLFLLAAAQPEVSWAIPPRIVEVQAESGVSAKAEIRAEYIQGEPIPVPISLVNATAQRVVVPDLATRPWLVEFHLVLPQGNDQVRKNSAPDADPGTSISIAPRGQRRVLLEVPASTRLRPGEYSLEVQIVLPSERLILPSQPISIVAADPVSADLSPQQHPGSKSEPLTSLWLHRASKGYDLYLHQARAARPGSMISDQFLFKTDEKFKPWLSETRSREIGTGHVTWQSGPRTIQVVRLEGSATPGDPSRLELPWPKVEIESRGITNAHGELHLPLWISAPQGRGGTLQLVRIDERGSPIFERLAHFERRPDHSLSMIDDAGQPHILLVHSGNLDRYSPRLTNPSGKQLPVPGTRLLRSRSGHKVIDLQAVALPESGDRSGALALLLTSVHEGQLHHTWISLGGAILQERTQPRPAGGLSATVANGWQLPGSAQVDDQGQHWLVDGGHRTPMTLVSDGEWQLYRSHDGTVHLRQVVAGGPIQHQRITP